MRKSSFLLLAVLIFLAGCSGNKQVEESKPKEQAVSSEEKQKTDENKPKEQDESSSGKQQTEESKPKTQTETNGVKQSAEENKPKGQTETSEKKSNDVTVEKPKDKEEIVIDFEIDKANNEVQLLVPTGDALLQLSVGQPVKFRHKNMDPDQPIKFLVSGDTLSIDVVPHEGRVAMPVEEYSVRAIKKGKGTISIAPNADLQIAYKIGVDIK
ncbi:hypothetical protein [Bacillus bombysepticus]|uniref:hypothetical protein n=1 Tax=Bacillus bombysepticus TaxID=658666 RepID=UPI0030183240